MKRKLSRRQLTLLLSMLLLSAACFALYFAMETRVPKGSYDTAVAAAARMQRCMDAIKEEKQVRGIQIPEEDLHQTGLIGEDYNFITTTLGDISAKRTTADPNMAAVLVFLLEEAGVQSGDAVGCNFSGSFPGLNLATICACDALGAVPVYIASCGASTWGANNPEFSFPEMAVLLYEQGLISTAPALITPGGGDDVGSGVDADLFETIWTRVEALGYPTLREQDYAKNLAARRAVFDAAGITCFVAGGGNITSLGYNMVVDLLGQGLITEKITSLNSGSGLLEQYLYEGMPSILLLNIRRLAADWGFEFDPVSQQTIGTPEYYYETLRPDWVLYLWLALETVLLFGYRSARKKKGDACI